MMKKLLYKSLDEAYSILQAMDNPPMLLADCCGIYRRTEDKSKFKDYLIFRVVVMDDDLIYVGTGR